jgi:flagellar biosynthesis chaperone FliJ
MNFVRDWNKEVEDSISMKLEGKTLIQQLNVHKALINQLNDTVVKQEENLITVQAQLDEANNAKIWFEKWKKEGVRDIKEADMQVHQI